jgi:hypothetical protein
MCASHLVAPIILDKGLFAFVAVSDKSSGHGLFDNMSHGEMIILPSLFAAQRHMRLFVTQATAGLFALGVHASELFVHLHRRAFRLEVAKRALGEEVQASRS